MANQFLVSFAVIIFIIVNLFIVALFLYDRTLRRRPAQVLLVQEGPPPPSPWIERFELEILMPAFKHSATWAGMGHECAVCLSELEENELCRLLPLCKHSFHTQCIDMWFSSHANCPLCRANVVSYPLPYMDGNSSMQGPSHAVLGIEIEEGPDDVDLTIAMQMVNPHPHHLHSYIASSSSTHSVSLKLTDYIES